MESQSALIAQETVVKFLTHQCPGEDVCEYPSHIPNEIKLEIKAARSFAWFCYASFGGFSLHPDSKHLIADLITLDEAWQAANHAAHVAEDALRQALLE